MAGAGLKIDTRRKRILELLSLEGKVSVSRLSQEFGTTPVTIRSDLDALEQAGHLERVQGGAIPKRQMPQPALPTTYLPEKQAIAAAAARLIRDGDTLFLNSGTTTREVAIALKNRRNLNIVTNSVAVASELSGIPSFRVILLGGELNVQYAFTCGGDAQEQLQKYQADYAILSLDGVSVDHGITTYHADEAIIDRLMVERAQKTVIVAVHTKMGHAGFSHISPIQQVHTVITDAGCDPQRLEEIRMAQVNVVLA